MNWKIPILLHFLFLGYSCKSDIKEDIPLPEITREGANTFGCYIGPARFIAETVMFGLVYHFNVQYYPDSTNNHIPGSLFIEATDDRETSSVPGTIYMQKMKVFDEGIYSLGDSDQDACKYEPAQRSKTFFGDSGKIVITRLDTANKIIAGKFYFTAKDSSNLTTSISNGRFDVHYNSQ
jgi:hypothetical protein